MNLKESLQTDKLVIVDFYSHNCMPCKRMAPVLDELKSKVQIIKLNVFDDIARLEAVEYNIDALPTLIFFKDGKEVKRLVGFQDKESILEVIDECQK